MSTKMVSSVKYFTLVIFCLGLVIACEKDFDNVGVELIDNNVFTPKDTLFETKAYNENVAVSRVDGIPQYILGVYNDPNFGLIKSAFYGQLSRATANLFGDNVSIDAVVLDIPYFVTAEANNTDGTPNFSLDSIIGDVTVPFTLSIYELNTYLNNLDPLDPSKTKVYFSNENYAKGALLYSDEFQPNKNDTVLYVDRRFIDADPNTIDDRDTIKAENNVPSMKFALDTTFFRNKFVNAPDGKFDSNDNFIDYFRGLALEADGGDGTLTTLAMTDATVNIYFTNTVLTDESDTDLNNDGDTDDTDVPVRTKQTMSFPMNGIRTNNYTRDYSTSSVNINDRFTSPNLIDGEEKLYIQGASGSNGVIELFENMDFDAIRNEQWLINEASITLYLDESSDTNVPEQLFLYKYDSNSQLVDVYTGYDGIGGNLVRDEENDNKPLKYEFSITDYFSELVESGGNVGVKKFGLKVYHTTDQPGSIIDTIIKTQSWIPKGVVLKGNLPETDANRLQLNVFYTIRE